jgi:hypothetical protein
VTPSTCNYEHYILGTWRSGGYRLVTCGLLAIKDGRCRLHQGLKSGLMFDQLSGSRAEVGHGAEEIRGLEEKL